MMFRRLAIVLTLLGAGILAWLFLVKGPWWLGVLLGCIEIFWISMTERGYSWANSMSLALLTGCAIYGLMENITEYLAYASFFISLAGWDLIAFSSRLKAVKEENFSREIIRQHILRLGIVLVAGIGCMILAKIMTVQMTFGWLVGIVSITILGMGKLISNLLARD